MNSSLFFTIIFLFATFNTKLKCQTVRYDLDSALLDKNSSLLPEMKGNALSLCCNQLLDLPLAIKYQVFSVKKDSIVSEGDTMKVYRQDRSFVINFFNNHPDVNRVEVVSGKIKSNKLFSNPSIKIGMKKEDLLNLIFKPSAMYVKINRLDIYENELGEALTRFIFKDGVLTEIQLASSYEFLVEKK